jgi:3-isopropylmalate/(R)-2-methylmalate dehydratase small subunit
MQAFTRIDGIAAPLCAADIDTDQIVPARFMHKPRENYGRYCFHDLRDDAGFTLNQAAYRDAQIIVAGPNFGCGSSREQAVHTLADYGIRALIGTSFGDIFYTNCLKNGVLPVRASANWIARLFGAIAALPGMRVTVDLSRQVVSASGLEPEPFEIDAFSKQALLAGEDEIDVTLRLSVHIDAWEIRHGIVPPSQR